MRTWLPLLLLLGLSLPFVGKPVHIDETNFLAMARYAGTDLWRPHDVLINWGGHTEPAFDVLSNPPGIAWWLSPVASAPVALQRLWMLPWLVLAFFGARGLCGAISGHGKAGALILLLAPIAFISSTALTPDLPLLALVLSGMSSLLSGGTDGRRQTQGALLIGLSACFRYSGIALLPLVFLWPWLHGQRSRALKLSAIALLPTAALLLHDLHAYGSPHLIAMMGFQATTLTPLDLLHKFAALLGMLGGAVVLPLLAWSHRAGFILGLMVGAGVGCTATALLGFSGVDAVAPLLFCSAGGASIGGAIRCQDKRDVFLLAWLGLGMLFLLSLRFAATRYWLPFFAPAILIPLRHATGTQIRAMLFCSAALSALLAVDDLELSLGQQRAAAMAEELGTGLVAGHWGFQHHLEQAGWTALEDDAEIDSGVLIATSSISWPQTPAEQTCLRSAEPTYILDRWPGPRVHTRTGRANLHGHSLADTPPVPTIAPWWFGDDPLDMLLIQHGCD